MRAVAAVWLSAIVCASACGDRESAKPVAVAIEPADAAAPVLRQAQDRHAAPVVAELAEVTGADAWRAVIDRARYLGRRGAEGVVVGRLGGATGDYRWLVDESEGGGALAIRVELPRWAAALESGERVQLRGAWWVDDERRWVWRAREVARQVGAPPVDMERAPGLVIEEIDAAPDGAAPPSTANRKQQVVFALLAPPVRHGDGWIVADAPGGVATAWLVLPGEHAIYGGQDLLAEDERWGLRVGKRYVVTARRVRRARGDELRTIYAADAPQALR